MNICIKGGRIKEVIKVFKALSDETRVRMLKILLEKESLCVCEIMQALNISQTRASRNLGILKEAGFLRAERKGTWVHYSVDKTNEYCKPIEGLLTRWLNADPQILKDRERLSKAVKSGKG